MPWNDGMSFKVRVDRVFVILTDVLPLWYYSSTPFPCPAIENDKNSRLLDALISSCFRTDHIRPPARSSSCNLVYPPFHWKCHVCNTKYASPEGRHFERLKNSNGYTKLAGSAFSLRRMSEWFRQPSSNSYWELVLIAVSSDTASFIRNWVASMTVTGERARGYQYMSPIV